MKATDLVSDEVSIPMPRVYKDFLVQKRLQYSIGLLAFYIALCTGIDTVVRLGGHSTWIERFGMLMHLLPALMGSVAWGVGLRKDWTYKIDGNGFSLIEWPWKIRVWNWHQLTWKRDVVFDMVQEEWRGLPALCLNTQIKPHKQLQKLVMVYAHEDAEKVKTQIMPLVERYRRQYRHELWADRLRS